MMPRLKTGSHQALYLTFLLLSCLFGCQTEAPQDSRQNITASPPDTIAYLALGDSYTIGEAVAESKRWPLVLAEKLDESEELFVEAPLIIAKTGWTTDELLEAIEKEDPPEDFDLVSLLIGVNNQYRGYDFSQYEEELPQLLDLAVQHAGKRGSRVFVLSIPDYGVTPFGQSRDSARIAREIDQYNAFAAGICADRDIPFFDITSISREALGRTDYVAKDGLHPSATMYADWVSLIQDSVRKMLLP